MNFIALKSSSFRLYFMGSVCAVNGLWIVRILIGWLAWELTHSASFVGLIAALSLVPSFVTGPFFGVIIDRANIKFAAFCTNISMLICVCSLLITHLLGVLSPTLLAIIATAIGTVAAAHHPVRLSMGPRLVKPEHVSSVVALAALSFNSARMISPALGGILIDQWGITAALVISLLFYIPSLSVLAFLKPREIQRSKAKESFKTALTNGFSYLWQRSDLRLIMLMTAVMSLSIRGTTEILPVVADGLFHKGPTGLGHLASAVGAGAVIASILKTFAPVQTSSALSLPSILCAIVGILSVALFGNSNIWILTLFAASILGACSTYLGVSLQSAVQTGLPDDMRGRVMSIWIVTSTGASALGAFLIGLATETLGLGNSAIYMTLFCLSTCIYLFIRTKKEGGKIPPV